jgi:hypothetical protein
MTNTYGTNKDFVKKNFARHLKKPLAPLAGRGRDPRSGRVRGGEATPSLP